MPLHDWTRVDAGIFHAFHVAWIPEIQKVLNGGLLPEGYYALAEQHAGRAIADVLTLHASSADPGASAGAPAVAPGDGRSRPGRCASPDAAPAHGRTGGAGPPPLPGHPPRQRPPPHRPHRDRLAGEQGPLAVTSRTSSTRPPPPWTSACICCWWTCSRPAPTISRGCTAPSSSELEASDEPYDVPADEPATLASYAAGPAVEIYVEHVAVGAPLPEMPLFLRPRPLHQRAAGADLPGRLRRMPAFWRGVLERGPAIP